MSFSDWIEILIFIFFNQIFFKNQNKFFENSLEKIIPDNIEIELKTPNSTVAISEQYQNNIDTQKIWQIEIPKINLVAPIAEGTSANIMNEYVGHFAQIDHENLIGNGFTQCQRQVVIAFLKLA